MSSISFFVMAADLLAGRRGKQQESEANKDCHLFCPSPSLPVVDCL